MGIATPTVLNALGQTTTATFITSASVSPAANALLVVVAGCPYSAGTALPCTFTDTLSGGPLTWTVYSATFFDPTSANIAIGVAKCGPTPGSGTITATFNVSLVRRTLITCQIASGFDTITPVRQSKTGGQSGGTTLALTLNSVPAPDSLVIGAVEHRQTTASNAAPGTNFTELNETAGGTGTSLEVEYDQDNATTTVDWTNISTTAVAVALEISVPKAFAFPLRPLRIWKRLRR